LAGLYNVKHNIKLFFLHPLNVSKHGKPWLPVLANIQLFSFTVSHPVTATFLIISYNLFDIVVLTSRISLLAGEIMSLVCVY